MNRSTKEILTKMFSIVGEEFYEEDVQESDWYMKFSWTLEQEKEFKDWMIDFLYTTPYARREMMRNPTKNKKYIVRVVDEFIFNYGFTTKD